MPISRRWCLPPRTSLPWPFLTTTIVKKSSTLYAGAISGGVSRLVAAPLDVIKIRFQVQVEPITLKGQPAAPKYTGLIQATNTIWREEGIKGFWRGNLTAEYLWIAFHGINFFCYDNTKNLFATTLKREKNDPWIAFVAGSVSGAVATSLSYPLDLIRTTLAAQGEPKVYKGIIGASRGIYNKFGLEGFFRGLGPQLVQIIPYIGLNFAIYEWCKTKILESTGKKNLASDEALCAGALGGGLSKLAVLPLDLCKKRLQVGGLERAEAYGISETYSGVVDCLSKILKREGFAGFYRGGVPSVLKSALATGLSFAIYNLSFVYLTESK